MYCYLLIPFKIETLQGPKVEILDDKDDDISIVINNAMSLLPDTKDILDTLHQGDTLNIINII